MEEGTTISKEAQGIIDSVEKILSFRVDPGPIATLVATLSWIVTMARLSHLAEQVVTWPWRTCRVRASSAESSSASSGVEPSS